MKHFLKKSILICLPIVISLVLLEVTLRNIPNDYSYKRKYLEKNSKYIQHLFLGSSHSYYGVNPKYIDGISFNASHVSQSIDYDFAIFNKFKNQLVNLESIIIPIDYFTLYSRTSTGLNGWRVKNYEIYYDINRSYKLKDHSELLSLKFSTGLKRAYSYLKNTNTSSITCNHLGYGNITKPQRDLNHTGITAAKRHTKKDKGFFDENLSIIYQIIEYAKQSDIKILFYTSPAFSSYRENLDLGQLNLTLKTIKDISTQNENCSYYNFMEDNDFNSNDFRDADHLNNNGAQKLSIKLNEKLKNM